VTVRLALVKFHHCGTHRHFATRDADIWCLYFGGGNEAALGQRRQKYQAGYGTGQNQVVDFFMKSNWLTACWISGAQRPAAAADYSVNLAEQMRQPFVRCTANRTGLAAYNAAYDRRTANFIAQPETSGA
jgi:hypothetical protein